MGSIAPPRAGRFALTIEAQTVQGHNLQNIIKYFGTSAETQQWAQPITDGVHGISNMICQLEVDVVQ